MCIKRKDLVSTVGLHMSTLLSFPCSQIINKPDRLSFVTFPFGLRRFRIDYFFFANVKRKNFQSRP